MAQATKPGEFEIIARYFKPLARGEPNALGLGDDAAVLAVTPGKRLVATMDTLIAGVHFLPDDSPAGIAQKLLRANLSDLAAMGATPRWYLLSLGLSETTPESWIAAFAAGLAADQAEFFVTLVGGDTVKTPGPVTVTVTALGEVAPGNELLRSGAKAGDAVYVSGTIGDGYLGLLAAKGELSGLSPSFRQFLIGRYNRPTPRLGLGIALARLGSKDRVHAAIDVSDGLIADLGQICEASGGLDAQIELGQIPFSEAGGVAIASDSTLALKATGGGDDYELLIAAPPAVESTLLELGRAIGVPVTRIGALAEGSGKVRVIGPDGREQTSGPGGYRHF